MRIGSPGRIVDTSGSLFNFGGGPAIKLVSGKSPAIWAQVWSLEISVCYEVYREVCLLGQAQGIAEREKVGDSEQEREIFGVGILG